ncbi:hypothetical protein [Leptolyngbya ohadii]|uniref:hypothetical protein n=1 Tax=Leptolyngbya ohadii TaxID=1962290 RepID=UPI000B59CF18|nr:hypothetical protein [Leptolyngbya ohadii]
MFDQTKKKDPEKPDPLTQTPAPDRLAYATGVLLDAQDFDAEQTYHRSRLARSLAFLHGSGTVAGLEVKAEVRNGVEELKVEAGIAIDRLGRLIELPETGVCLRLNRWYDAQSKDDLIQAFYAAPYNGVVADLFVRFVACERGKTPAFATGAFDATDAIVPSRIRDAFEVNLILRKDIRPDATPPQLKLPQSPFSDLAPVPGETPADRLRRLQADIFRAWQASSQRGSEYTEGQDITAVFLARVTFPATSAPPGGRPTRTRTPLTSADIDNSQRLFVYPTGAIVQLLNL